MKLCIVSDSHDRAPMLAAAVAAGGAGAQALHCGDLIGAMSCPLLELGSRCTRCMATISATCRPSGTCARTGGLINYHGADADLRLAGRRLFATHYPHYARGMACTGDYDIVCCGHSHQASAVQQRTVEGGSTWLVNPGTVAALGGPATWMLADLVDLRFEVQAVPV
jgi:hypothetical protein